MKFYARIPNSVLRVAVSRYGASIIEDVVFGGDGMIDTDDTKMFDELLKKATEDYLSAIVDRPGSGVFSQSNSDIDAAMQEERAADMRRLAAEAHAKMIAAGEKTS